MYKILGGDGKEYGPVSVDTLRQWVAEGRANAQTQVQPEGGTSWIPLGQVGELADAFTVPGPSVPPSAMPPMPGAVASNATQIVAGPAIALIVTACIGALAQVASILINLLGIGMAGIAGSQGSHNQELPAWVNMMSGGVGIAFNILGLAMSVVVFMGAMKMKKLEAFGFAMAATIIAMVPCVSPCCWIGLPVGIWALVVLNKPEVKSAFH